jgi:hypothetical protein
VEYESACVLSIILTNIICVNVGRGSESSDKASERLISVRQTRVLTIGYFVSFSISFVLVLTCSLVVYENVSAISLVIFSVIFLTATATAYKRFTSTKISNFALGDRKDIGSNTAQSLHTDFNVLLNKGEMLHRARALGDESYHKAKKEFLQIAYDLIAVSRLEPMALEVIL